MRNSGRNGTIRLAGKMLTRPSISRFPDRDRIHGEESLDPVPDSRVCLRKSGSRLLDQVADQFGVFWILRRMELHKFQGTDGEISGTNAALIRSETIGVRPSNG